MGPRSHHVLRREVGVLCLALRIVQQGALSAVSR